MFFLFFILGYIAWLDITKRKIFNRSIVILLLIIFWSKFFSANNLWFNEFLESIASLFFYFFIFLFFYFLKFMGAGDVKLGAVLAFFFGLQDFFVVWLISIALALGYVALVKIAYMAGWEVLRQKLTFKDVGKKYVPYGALLCFASMFYILRMEDIL